MLCLIHGDPLSALFSLHDFICSKYVEKKKRAKTKKKKNTQQNQTTRFGQKNIIITFKVIFSVSNLELRGCLSVLLVSVWPCFASMSPVPSGGL